LGLKTAVWAINKPLMKMNRNKKNKVA